MLGWIGGHLNLTAGMLPANNTPKSWMILNMISNCLAVINGKLQCQ